MSVALLLSMPSPDATAAEPVNKSRFTGVALKGYDPVAYFAESRPVKGTKAFQHTWKGATWRFSSAQNRDLFAAAPRKYAPQYGGYCAWAMRRGDKAPISPDAWKIVDGKLYLNYSKKIQKSWEQEASEFIRKADKYWSLILNE